MQDDLVLVVDDDDDIRDAMALVVEQEGFRVLTAASGRQALELLHEEAHPQSCIVLTDVFMPEMSGPQLAEAILGDPELTDLPVFFLTASTPPDVRGLGLKAENILCKPVSAAAVIALIRGAFAAQQVTRH